MSEKQDWRWLSQWTPTFAVLVALLAAVVPASFHLGSELGRLDRGQAELKAGLLRVEARVDSLAERMETRMDAFETRIESLLGELREDLRKGQADMANLRERVTALEAAS